MEIPFDPSQGHAAARRIPRRSDALIFAGKAMLLCARRWVQDLSSGPRRHRSGPLDSPSVTESRTLLWSGEDAAGIDLVAGKIQNLRVAVRRLNGVCVPAGEVFGFWRQLGRATRWRGYVRGRELREGCVVPSIGGGLCQLSNAVYDAALRHGLEIVERHRHSRVIPGSLAERDRDAVVFWNYLDLRLRAPFAWRLECWLDGEHLHVRIGSTHTGSADAWPLLPARSQARKPPTGDCGSCGRSACHRHAPAAQTALQRTWLVDDDWPEFAGYRRHQAADADRRIELPAGALRALLLRVDRRIACWRGIPLPCQRLQLQRRRAWAFARRLRADDVDLVVPQSLLPWLWMDGALQGRRFDVLMTAQPMHRLQAQLDRAAGMHASSATLVDFRAETALVEAERAALAHARCWIGPHRQVLALAGPRAVVLPWSMPPTAPTAAIAAIAAIAPIAPIAGAAPRRITLAASALARKGANELEHALRGLPVELCLPPGAGEDGVQWSGIAVVRAGDWSSAIHGAELVVLPAWVEHRPRGLLLAMQLGIAVLASVECGLPPDDARWTAVPAGDVAALRAAICAALDLDDAAVAMPAP